MNWKILENKIEGELHIDRTSLVAYATDASVYRKIPQAVVFPKNGLDIIEIVRFAGEHKIPIIPRAAGTSLAGQCVGEGMVVDISRYFNSILTFNSEEEWVEVEPGVIRDDLNRYLKPHGYFFSPNTSTASRCMTGGMVGNNSCGTTSVKYGTTRDKVLELEVILSDASTVIFTGKSKEELNSLSQKRSLEGRIYSEMIALFSEAGLSDQIERNYPKSSIHRRNTGYAIDEIISQQPFNPQGIPFDLCKILTGSEGTLGITTRIRLHVDRLPPKEDAVICIHFETLRQSMEAAVLAMTFEPFACELMDRTILNLTKDNIEQAENRFFVEGDPAAILAVELRHESDEELDKLVHEFIEKFKSANLGCAFPVVKSPESQKIWDLRAAGLGVLSNMPGDAKPVAFVEDTAVAIDDLPEYISEFEKMMTDFGQQAVYYAHAGAGELHLRPILNLKSARGQKDFRAIGEASAGLVKKYRGSLSGEHGDGRVRAEFIPKMIGDENYELLRKIKTIWDPHGIFNPGKIVDAFPMDADFRYSAGQEPFSEKTFLNFGSENMLQAAERCNGSGDCRKPQASSATMCPSYQATRHELDSTRARANLLREGLTNPESREAIFNSDDVKSVLDLCLSCKACKRECPSGVDMAALKAEYMYQYQTKNGFSRRTKFFGQFHKKAALASSFSAFVNPLLNTNLISGIVKKYYAIHPDRSIPQFSRKRASKHVKKYASNKNSPDFLLYIDEFTEYQDAGIAEAAARLFQRLGYEFAVAYSPSARAAISKAMLDDGREAAERTLEVLKPFVEKGIPIVGLEPSGILGFKDDFLKIVSPHLREAARNLSKVSFTFEEFLFREMECGKLGSSRFTEREKEVHIHLHCHQKALSHIKYSKAILGLPKNYRVQAIPSGCCGMAGSFGFEKEHYQLSQDIGEMVLFPHIRNNPKAIIAAAGTSCRHQILDGVKTHALHPAEILLQALK